MVHIPRKLLGAGAALAATVGLWVAPAGAGLGPVTYVFDPTSGPPGTVVTVTGDDCFESEVTFWDSTFGIPVQIGSTVPEPDGSFVGTFTISPDAEPGTQRQVGAQCPGDGTQYILFEVTEPPVTTTAPPETATTLPGGTAIGVDQAPARPRFTG